MLATVVNVHGVVTEEKLEQIKDLEEAGCRWWQWVVGILVTGCTATVILKQHGSFILQWNTAILSAAAGVERENSGYHAVGLDAHSKQGTLTLYCRVCLANFAGRKTVPSGFALLYSFVLKGQLLQKVECDFWSKFYTGQSRGFFGSQCRTRPRSTRNSKRWWLRRLLATGRN